MFGLREVLNRVHFVRKYPDLSLAKCRAALCVRLMMNVAWAAKELKRVHLERAWGNAVGLARSFEPGPSGPARAAVLVYGQVPPPHNGSNVMTRHFLTAVRKSGYETVLSRKSLSAAVADVNRIRPIKFFRLLATWGRLAGNLRRTRPALAVVFTSSTLVGLAAESVVVALCRLSGVPYVLYLHSDVHRRVPAAPVPPASGPRGRLPLGRGVPGRRPDLPGRARVPGDRTGVRPPELRGRSRRDERRRDARTGTPESCSSRTSKSPKGS